ncbi:MAG: hypothetical protein ABW040_07005 [Microbacteriaceae bacterium]
MSGTPAKRPAYEPAARLLKPTGYDPGMARPVTIYAGVGLVLLRVLAGVFAILGIAFGWSGIVVELEASIDGFEPTSAAADVAKGFLIAIASVFVVLDALFALFAFRGLNGARILLMIVSTISIATTFVSWWAQGQEITLDSTFVSLSLDILILLAVSSRSAAAYARRNERP